MKRLLYVKANSKESPIEVDIREMNGMTKHEIRQYLEDLPIGSKILNVTDKSDRFKIDTKIEKQSEYKPNMFNPIGSPNDFKIFSTYWAIEGYEEPYIVSTIYNVLNGTDKYYMVSPRAK